MLQFLSAMESLDREEIHDLHYSGAVSLSRKDCFKLKDRILEFLKEFNVAVKSSQEEEVHCLAVDFFSLKK